MTRIDRRALFTSGAAAALLAASGLAPDRRPRSGGRLRVALARDGNSLERFAHGAIFETLTEVAPDGVLKGELATGWHGSSDARIWTLSLRQDAVFHDGSVLEAGDVLASLEGFADTRKATVIATGAAEIRIELAESDAHLPYQLADPSLVIARGGVSDGGNGTGLYHSARLQADRHFLGQRVTRHWKDGQAGWVESVDAIVISDPAVRAEALRDGFVDVAELPEISGLAGRTDFVFHPSAENAALAARGSVGVPARVGTRFGLDDGRLAQRWWVA